MSSILIGDKLEIIPNHIGPTVNQFDEVVVVRNNRIEITWKVAAHGKVR
jgi:D-serine deaminase-like pyridoxal phosphate-dependent protein